MGHYQQAEPYKAATFRFFSAAAAAGVVVATAVAALNRFASNPRTLALNGTLFSLLFFATAVTRLSRSTIFRPRCRSCRGCRQRKTDREREGQREIEIEKEREREGERELMKCRETLTNLPGYGFPGR